MMMITILLIKNSVSQHQKKFAARLAQANLTSKSDIANFIKKTDFDDKLKNQIKVLLQIKQKMHLLITNLTNIKDI